MSLNKSYSVGAYNKSNDTEQWIRITEGCPNDCQFCYESKVNGKDPIYYEIPEIVRNKVKIMDMNLLSHDKALNIIMQLGTKRVNGKVVYYELICGIDWRFLNQEIAYALKANRFINIRFAWDYEIDQMFTMKYCIKLLEKAGYKASTLSCFIICNWRISYNECMRKLDLLKIWRVKALDCYYDGQTYPFVKSLYWTEYEMKEFRRSVRKHNQMVRFGIDPEINPPLKGNGGKEA